MNVLNRFFHTVRYLTRAHKYRSGYDKDEIQYVIDNLKPGDVAFDIGAHKGAYAYWMRKAVTKSGRILCIEPQPILFKYLTELMSAVHYSNIDLLDCAVSENDGEAEITVPGQPGSVSQGARIDDQKIVEDKHKEDRHSIKVTVRSVDSIIRETGLHPKMVKIDVEGHEFSVLKGMKLALDEIRPKLIVECEARHIKDHTVFDVFDYILERKYIGFYYHDGIKKDLSTFDIFRDQTSFIESNKKLDTDYIANFIFEPIKA